MKLMTNNLAKYSSLKGYGLAVAGRVTLLTPFKMNCRLTVADAVCKVVIISVLALWAWCSTKGSFCWFITAFSLSTLTNSLVVGVLLIRAMYGSGAVDLIVQSSVTQSVIWLTLLMFILELWHTRNDFNSGGAASAPVDNGGDDLEGNGKAVVENKAVGASFWRLMRAVSSKLATNPNTYGCVSGIVWAFVSNRLHLEMPSVIEGCVLVMSRAYTGTAMFSMGLFMALQEKVVACGASLTVVGMILKFVVGPAAMALASIAVGLRGNVLRVAIIQAALPQSITSIFAVG